MDTKTGKKVFIKTFGCQMNEYDSDKMADVLGAGARIRDQGNLQPRPATLAGQTFVVNYTVDTQGLLKEVWILRPEEAARKPWPASADEAKSWRFDPVAQTWTKP